MGAPVVVLIYVSPTLPKREADVTVLFPFAMREGSGVSVCANTEIDLLETATVGGRFAADTINNKADDQYTQPDY